MTIERTRIGVELRKGWLYKREDEAGQSMRVVTAVDGARFNALWLSVVTGP